MIVEDGLEWVSRFRCGIFGVRMVDVDTAAVGGDHVGDIQLRCIGEHVRACRSAFKAGATRIVDRIFLPVIPSDVPAMAVCRTVDHIERQLHRVITTGSAQ